MKNRVAYLDGIRAIAIVAVLVVHWVASQFSAGYGGYIGVDVFFVLSGYIITSMLWKKTPHDTIGSQYATFLKRRVARLYPALIAFVLITMLVFAVFPGAPMSVGELVIPALVALGQGYSLYAGSGLADASPFAITWSLSIEWIFYLLWPLAIYKAKRAGISATRVATWCSAIAAAIYCASLFQDSHWFYYGPVARVPELMLGGVLALGMSASPRLESPPQRARLALAGAVSALAFLAVYTVIGPVQWSPVFRFAGLPLTVAATLYLIWYGRRAPESRATRLLSWAPIAFIGRVSYSLYLWHMIGLNLFTRENLGSVPLPVVALIAVGFSILMTALSYRLLELPFMRSQGAVLRKTGAVGEDTSAPSLR